MSHYRHILVAVEAGEEADRLLAHARELGRLFGAELSVLNVVEPMPMDLNGDLGVIPMNLDGEMREQARKTLQPLCAAHGLEPARLRIEVGQITATILAVAAELGANLIVLGHHRQRGLAALFSHTDKGVVSKAHCDVLAVALTPAKASAQA
ncbi:universal stress protein [Stagnimonas aquatica]|uniref:Universal stress protein n=1 Tax=Stagnimonas aquatica TaxID=2689987 RepID=A0A3N0VGR8_9GAMM|nr:universal stress protein [Stagnimonas aquatica]ROH91946.1 universal stress protein [Stagnimonas aquatica]